MSILAFLWALFTQIPAGLEGNAWGVKALQLTLANLHAIQAFFGWIALVSFVLLVILAIVSVLRGGSLIDAAGGMCLIYVLIMCIIFWLVGFLHILAVGYLVANFTLAGAANLGFWIVLIILIL